MSAQCCKIHCNAVYHHSQKKAGSRDPGSHDFFWEKLGQIEKIRTNRKIRKNIKKIMKNSLEKIEN